MTRKAPQQSGANASASIIVLLPCRVAGFVGHPGCALAIIFKAGRGFQRILGGIHSEVNLVVLQRFLDGVEADRHVFLAGPEKATDADD
jgi:hypothetical protein